VTADIRPTIGRTLAVRRIVGRVVRHLEAGFALRFVQLQDQQTVESLATRAPKSGTSPDRSASRSAKFAARPDMISCAAAFAGAPAPRDAARPR
jgi:hypothetical protein